MKLIRYFDHNALAFVGLLMANWPLLIVAYLTVHNLCMNFSFIIICNFLNLIYYYCNLLFNVIYYYYCSNC